MSTFPERAAILFPLTAGFALVLCGAFWRTKWRSFAFWLAVALLGQTTVLQLVRAGQMVGYQHLVSPLRLQSEAHPALLALLAFQFVVVVTGYRGFWRLALAWLLRTFGGTKLAVIAGIFVLSSATLSREVPVYVAELFFASFLQVLNLATIVLVARAVPDRALEGVRTSIDNLLGARAEGLQEPAGLDRFVLVAAACVVFVTAMLATLVYERHPHVPDEVSYLYHARYLAHGMLSMPVPPVPEAFNVDLMTYEATRWYSPVPPGWPFILALGVLAGVPWLVNPVLAGLCILLAYAALRDVYNLRTARLAVILLATSPWFLFMAMSLMTHTLTLTCALGAAVAVARLRRSGNLTWAWLGGIAIGLVSLIRPLEGVLVAGLLGLWALPVWGRRLRFSPVVTLALGSLIVGGVVFPYNRYLTGRATDFPINAYTDKLHGVGSNTLGFGANRGMGWSGLDPFPGHGAIDVLVNANLNTYSLNVELLGWSVGSLLVLSVLLVSRPRWVRADLLMLAVLVSVVGIHSFYWFSGGPDFGARYWYLILVPCIALTARGVEILADQIAKVVTGAGARVVLAALLLCLLSVATFVPWRSLDKYYHYRRMRPDIRDLARERSFGRSLVLVQGRRHPDYASAVAYNPVDLNANAPVYAWDRGPEVRTRLMDIYADRPIWVVAGPTITGRGFEVLAGPLPWSALRSDSAASVSTRAR
ncbi:MAG: ArnT family glycosyltransferase [Gemmatimonadaceae bacterium]